eukprot:scaffold109849_cov116-Cyclotella_meneghiniana.AAC.1
MTICCSVPQQRMYMSLMIVRSGWEIHIIPREIVGVRAVLPSTKDPLARSNESIGSGYGWHGSIGRDRHSSGHGLFERR